MKKSVNSMELYYCKLMLKIHTYKNVLKQNKKDRTESKEEQKLSIYSSNLQKVKLEISER